MRKKSKGQYFEGRRCWFCGRKSNWWPIKRKKYRTMKVYRTQGRHPHNHQPDTLQTPIMMVRGCSVALN